MSHADGWASAIERGRNGLRRAVNCSAQIWRRLGDLALQERITTYWRWLGPAALALALYWPIFLPGYRLQGGFANEILMVNGLRTAFNRALLTGDFPLWNEWVASGKPFLI